MSGIITQVTRNGIEGDDKMANKKKITIYLEQDTIKRLKMEALKADKTLSSLIEEATQAALKSNQTN